MQVAVVRSCGGNQAAEIAGGAAITVTPLSPFRMAHMWLITVNVTSSLDTALKTSQKHPMLPYLYKVVNVYLVLLLSFFGQFKVGGTFSTLIFNRKKRVKIKFGTIDFRNRIRKEIY